MKRGEIYWADVAPRAGSEQTGRRPVIIVSHDAFNQVPGWQSIIVVPMTTSRSQAERGPTAVEIAAQASGLSKAGIALCHQVTTLDRGKMSNRVGVLPERAMRSVEEGMKAALDLE